MRAARLLIAATVALVATRRAGAQPAPGDSTAPALRSTFVADVPGVRRRWLDVPGARLQWLDFGGTGEAVVLLAGLGNNAWNYSAFGPALARQGFRVVALTRRAHGESEAPPTGYALDTLVGDVLALMDSLGMRRAHLVGHSFAGAELTRLAARHPARVGRLVYLDAAYDRQAQEKHPPEPYTGTRPPTPADRASPAAYLAWQRHVRRADLAQAWGPPVERDMLASLVRAPDGAMRWRHPFGRYDEMIAGASKAPPEYAEVRAPSLAIYVRRVRTLSSAALPPDFPAASRDSVLAFERDVIGPWTDASIAQFRAGGGTRCVVELDAIHHVHLQREAQVVRLVRDFVRGRAVACR